MGNDSFYRKWTTIKSSKNIYVEYTPIIDELTPIQWADVYHTVFNSAVFFGPAIAIVTSYIR